MAVILREIGYDERTIADALGRRTIEMARHYAKGADLTAGTAAASFRSLIESVIVHPIAGRNQLDLEIRC